MGRLMMKERRILLSHVSQLMVMMMMMMRMNDGGGERDSAGGCTNGSVGRQRRLRLGRVKRMAVTCNQARVAAVGVAGTVSASRHGRCSGPVPGPTTVRRALVLMMMAKDDPREGHGSLMMLRGTVRVVRLRDHVVTRGWRMRGTLMVVTSGRRVVIRVVGAAIVIVVIVLLLRLSLIVLLVLHPTILEPDLHLTLGQVQIARQFPSFLLRHVRVVQKLLLEFEGLKLRIGLAFLPHRHLAGPFEGVRAAATDAHPGHADTDADSRQGTCGKQRRWGGTPHHLTQLVCR